MADQVRQGLLSPWLQSRRLAAAKPYVQGSVLDFGCGSGALAEYVAPESYTGYDVDEESLDRARSLYPKHKFIQSPPTGETFDRVVSLAVIEHMADPRGYLSQLVRYTRPSGRIVLTTPNPKLEQVHHWGTRFGLFSHEAEEEHVSLLDRAGLLALANQLSLSMIHYKTFLLRANQLVILEHPSGRV